ncbi:MAG: flagellar basal body P-ring formation protein FlgA [Maricaulaceae bacterium]|nr:flagellar basal body P-ring formation protein FlgA [Maricaulaceae bacterium]
MSRALAALALLVILAAAPAAAQEPVLLREPVSVRGAEITLRDLFGVEGEGADAVIARAPAPGATLSLDPEYVREAAARQGYRWANPSGLRRVSVARESRIIGAETVRELIAAELFARDRRPHEVRLSSGALILHAPAESAGGPEILALDHDPSSGLVSALIATHDGAEPVRIAARAHATADVPVLARPVAAGETITDADIDWVPMRADRLRADAVMDADRIAGRAARRALRAGEPLRAYDLREPVVVSRGEVVNLVFRSGSLTLTARARALQDGGAGQNIRFVNLQSNRTVEAVVTGAGQARVGRLPAEAS